MKIQPRLDVKLVKNVRIPMRDGIHLSADLLMPEMPGKYPAIIQYHPYRKDDMSVGANEFHYYFAENGYVSIRLDVRGTGSSEGRCVEEYSLEESSDAVDAINWIAAQEWCTGKVGMYGWSYSGQTSMTAALKAPEPLKAVVCGLFSDDRYTADSGYEGGSVMPMVDYGQYGTFMIGFNAMPTYPEYSGKEWMNIWRKRLEESTPWVIQWLSHPLDEEYWRPASVKYHYDEVKAAVFLVDGWRDGYPGAAAKMYANLKVPKKLLMGPWLHSRPDQGPLGPTIDIHQEMLRWWDHWLKGVENGIMGEPPVSIYVQKFDKPAANRAFTSGEWRAEKEWPIARTKGQTFRFQTGGRLTTGISSKSSERAVDSFEYRPEVGLMSGVFSATSPHFLPVDQRPDEALSLNYTTEALRNDLEVTGFPKARLFVSSTSPVSSIAVRLSDVAPDGTSALVQKGALNLTRRNSFEKPEPLKPGKVNEVEVELNVNSWVFEKGHKNRVSVSGSDWPNMWPTPEKASISLHLGDATPSGMILPSIPKRKGGPPQPRYDPPRPFRKIVDVSPSPVEYEIVRDLYSEKVTLRLKNSGLTVIRDPAVHLTSSLQSEATVDPNKPWEAHVKGRETITLKRRDQTIVVEGEDLLSSTKDAFDIRVTLNVTIDGMAFFNKTWHKSVPRILS
ncbi:MAG: CocE/NonD family hydrolase [Thaumarchaeota archaeon]|nr:CocE/NonD family hydrolase [Nitrososphaerota archaeon]